MAEAEARRKGLPERDCFIPFNAVVYYDALTDIDYLRLWVKRENVGENVELRSPIWLSGHINEEMKLIHFKSQQEFSLFDSVMNKKVAEYVKRTQEEQKAQDEEKK